jgi:predicted Zn finger-like uncharacterized protein
MIAACPKCAARYRIDDGRLPPQGARLRCARCEAVFKVRGAGGGRPERAATTGPAPAGQAAAALPPQPDAPRPVAERDLVLVADAEVGAGRATAAALAGWGLRTLLVHDGVEAILSIQRALPRAVVIDAALPKMFGFQICELMKRNESLRRIHVVLVGAIHDHERYRRPPSELYGADAYLERPQLPDGLRPLLRGFGLHLAEPATVPEAAVPRPRPGPAAVAPPQPRPGPAAVAPPPAAPAAPSRTPSVPRPAPIAPAPREALAGSGAAPAPGLDPAEIEKAERLARIVVSDIVLYNPRKFEAALVSGNVLEAMTDELEEGRGLFRQRIDAAVRESRDFLAQELLRVARQRGAG